MSESLDEVRLRILTIFNGHGVPPEVVLTALTTLQEAVRADECEACAKECDAVAADCRISGERYIASECAGAVRDRLSSTSGDSREVNRG